MRRPNFTDIITGGKEAPVKTTANIYMSFHAPDAPIATIPNLMADVLPKETAPVLWVAGSTGPEPGHRAQGLSPACRPTPLNRYATVDADHGGTPDASGDAVIAWLKTLP